MEETQLFRLTGTAEIMEVPVDYLDGQNIIYWEDIEEFFPGVKHVMNGRVAIKKLRDSNRKRIEPPCIRHHPGEILEVTVFSSDLVHVNSPANALCDAPADIRSDSRTDAQTVFYHLGAHGDGLNDSRQQSSCAKTSEASSHAALAESVSSLAVASEAYDGQALTEQRQAFQTVIHKLDAIHVQGATTQQIAQEVLKLQKQMNDRLILIQSKTEAILTQQLEIAEYPIPRLFIVLPEELVKYDPANWFRTKFRLHFICECGKHTEASNCKIKHHLHLAKHEGYLVREPTEFFKKYGPFLVLMLELIKFGTAVAGHVVTALATLQAIELVDSVKQSVELITAKIDLSLECIDKQLTKVQSTLPEDCVNSESQAIMTSQDLNNYLNNVEGLEGVELRQLGSFLKTTDAYLLGNLYRMTTSDGHVKWVCRDHYRASYQEKQVEKLREVVKLARGVFDEQLGRITISLTSSIEAAAFYSAVSKAKGVLELDISFKWECEKSDLDAFRTTLKSSRVSIVRVSLPEFRTSRLLPTSSKYGSLLGIQQLAHMKLLHIVLPQNLVKLPSYTSKTSSRHCRVSVTWTPPSVVQCQELAVALKTNSILTTLVFHNSIESDGMKVLAEALKINKTLTNLNLQGNAIGVNGERALAEALKINKTLTNLNLQDNSLGDNGGQALAEALK
ncbi:hypothetical protein BGZ67_006820, partial [Mortierella alpina]